MYLKTYKNEKWIYIYVYNIIGIYIWLDEVQGLRNGWLDEVRGLRNGWLDEV